MTLKELRDNVLRVLWMEGAGTIPDYIYEDATTAINSALQLMHQSPLDYFRKEEGTLYYSAGTSSANLNTLYGANELIGPVWIEAENNRELHRITDESEFNQFFPRFYGKTEAQAVADGVPAPSYYFVKTRREAAEDSGRDSSGAYIEIKPTPTADVSISLIYARKAAVFETSYIKDLSGSEVTPVPADAVETILLPLARMYAMRSHFFFEKDKIPMFEQDSARAMQSLQVSDPEMGTKSHMAEQLRKQFASEEE